MFLFGYWFLGNRQIFYNVTEERKYSWTEADPKHGVIPLEYDATTLILILLIQIILGCVII
jgi:hypothetical protein